MWVLRRTVPEIQKCPTITQLTAANTEAKSVTMSQCGYDKECEKAVVEIFLELTTEPMHFGKLTIAMQFPAAQQYVQ